MKCSKCSFNNPVGSKYCQHCGTRLHVQAGKVARVNGSENRTKDGVRSQGVTVIPLAKKHRDISGKIMPQISITPHEDGTWFCPLCGDKNAELICKSCYFERMEKVSSR
ncbi:hypothetical protein [Anaerosporobacter sp.]